MKKVISQEADRISTRRIAWITVLSLVVGIGGIAVSRVLDLRDHARSPAAAPETIGEIEQGAIGSTERGITMRRAQEASLQGYHWRDRDAGVAEIPIERAMQIVEERAR